MNRCLYILAVLLLGFSTAWAFPDATTTGIVAADCPDWPSKATTTGRTITQNGTVVYNEQINGTLNIRASNVVLRCLKINPGLYGIDCFINGNNCSGLQASNIEISNCDSACILSRGGAGALAVWDKIHLHHSNKDLMKIEGNTHLKNSYLHDYTPVAGSHNDGIQTSRGDNIILEFNRLDGPFRAQTSAYILKTDFASTDGVLIRGNYLSGGAFTLYLRDGGFQPPDNVVVRDNIFERNSSQFGPFSVDRGTPVKCLEWYNNVFHDGTAMGSPGNLSAIGACDVDGQEAPDNTQAAAPSISPNGYVGLESQSNVTLTTTETAPYSIYYTLDGTFPTAASTLYEEPFVIASTLTLKAVTVKAGLNNSAVTSAAFEVNDFEGNSNWKSFDFEQQTARFTATVEIIPHNDPMDIVVGLGPDIAVSDFVHQAAQLRLNSAGNFDARNAGAYAAANALAYNVDTVYEAFFDVNVATKTYTVIVTPAGGDSVVIGQDYAFRTEQAAANDITTLSFRSTSGTATVRGFRVLETCQ